MLKPNDILFVRSSLKQEGVGWSSLFHGYTEPVTFCGFLIRARLNNEGICSEFLVNYLRLPTVRKLLISKSGKLAITNINQGNLKTIPLPLPSIQEQQKIYSILSTVDSKIEAEENRKEALEDLFKTLLTYLMTGKIRVNNSEVKES